MIGMSRTELRVELEKRYCPVCRFDTQHAVLMQAKLGFPRAEELTSACGVCNADGFWALRLSPVAVEAEAARAGSRI